MFATGRRKLLLGAGALALAGCGDGGGGASIPASTPEDMVVGQANAPATLIEYASPTCPHCADFHHQVWDQLKANYIDTGKLRYIFREYPTAPGEVAVAGFQIARCNGANADTYMARIGELFRQRENILGVRSMEEVRVKLIGVGATMGLSEQQVMACINDREGQARVERTTQEAAAVGIDSTPTLILNGTKLDQVRDASVVTYAGMARLIDAAIAS